MAYGTVLLSANMLFTCLTTSPQSPIFSSAMQCSIYSPSPYIILLTCSAKTKKWHFHIFKDGAILGMHTMFECTKNYTNRTGIEWATMNLTKPIWKWKVFIAAPLALQTAVIPRLKKRIDWTCNLWVADKSMSRWRTGLPSWQLCASSGVLHSLKTSTFGSVLQNSL
jgi:hypothetical protein